MGDYEIENIKKQNNYLNKVTLVPTKDKSLPNLVIRFYPNEKIAKNALKIGEVQSLVGINDTSDLSSSGNIFLEFNKQTYNRLVGIFYNTKDPILSDENFRLALSFGAPSIIGETKARTTIPPTSWAFNEDAKEFLDNQEQAQEYLAKVKNGKDSTIVLTATSNLKAQGERVVEAWKRAGIKAVLRVESGVPQNFQALLITSELPSDPDQYALWHSTQTSTNVSKFSQPRVDKDLEDGRKVADLETRKARYKDFQKVLLDHAPITPLYFPKYNVIYLKKVESKLKKVLDIQLSNI